MDNLTCSIVMIESVTYMCVVWENTSSTSFGRFLTSVRLFIVGSFFFLKRRLLCRLVVDFNVVQSMDLLVKTLISINSKVTHELNKVLS